MLIVTTQHFYFSYLGSNSGYIVREDPEPTAVKVIVYYLEKRLAV